MKPSTIKKIAFKLLLALSLTSFAGVSNADEIDDALNDFYKQNDAKLEAAKKEANSKPSWKLEKKIRLASLKYRAKENPISQGKTCEEFVNLFVHEQMLGDFEGNPSKYVERSSDSTDPFVTRHENGTIERFGYGVKNGFVFFAHWEFPNHVSQSVTRSWVIEILRPDAAAEGGPNDGKTIFQTYRFYRDPNVSAENDICQLESIELNVSGDFINSNHGVPKSYGDTISLSIKEPDCIQAQKNAQDVLKVIRKHKSIADLPQFESAAIPKTDLYALMVCRPVYAQFFASSIKAEAAKKAAEQDIISKKHLIDIYMSNQFDGDYNPRHRGMRFFE